MVYTEIFQRCEGQAANECCPNAVHANISNTGPWVLRHLANVPCWQLTLCALTMH